MPQNYRVTWTDNLNARSPEHAARLALARITRSDSQARSFEVTGNTYPFDSKAPKTRVTYIFNLSERSK